MKAKKLLSQLSNIEALLNDFSYEELNISDSTQLKKSFQSFKTCLEAKMFQPSGYLPQQGEKPAFKPKEGVKQEPKKPNIGHEIYTPIHGILGIADLLRAGGLTEDQHHQVNAIQNATQSLRGFIKELLDPTDRTIEIEQLEMVSFNFKNVVGEVLYLCKLLIDNENVRLTHTIDEAIPRLLVGNPSKLSQVLLNLLGDTIKNATHGSIELKIGIHKIQDNGLQLAFLISGADSVQPNPNNSTYEAMKIQQEPNPASVVGNRDNDFAKLRQLIGDLGGELAIVRESGIGTSFKFMLPYGVVKKSIMVKQKDNSGIDQLDIEAVKDLQILVFEDNTLNQKLIDTRLKSWGCETYITENAHYGLQILEDHEIDIVLMDLRMPGKDGFEVTQMIRKSANVRVRQVPVIALTADFSIQNMEACNDHQINDFVLKPYTPEELLSKLIKNKGNESNIDQIQLENQVSEDEEVIDGRKIDLTTTFEECMFDFELLENLVMLYKQNVLEFIGSVSTHLKHGDFEQIGFAAHKVKAGLAMMKTYSLHSIVVEIQKHCNGDQDHDMLISLYEGFLKEFPCVESEIDIELNRIKNNK